MTPILTPKYYLNFIAQITPNIWPNFKSSKLSYECPLVMFVKLFNNSTITIIK